MSRSTKLILLLLALTLSAFAAVPTITGISVTSVTHNSAYVCYNVMPTSAWSSVQYGTASGVYGAGPTNNYQVSSSSPFLAGQACFSLTNLKGSTTYYILPTAQPNQTNTTDVCNVSGCGAVEQIITTPADPGSPVFPTAPATFAEPNPDTSIGYTTVRMIAGSPECTAASTVGPITYGMTSWTVHSGDTIQTVINEVGYGAILEFDQGVTCLVPGVNTYNSGYWFGYKAVDPNASGINDPAHRYIIFQTKTVAAADFPPFGVRTSPALAPNIATWQANTQETVTTGLGQTLSVIDNPGSGSTMTPHHLLVRNMAFQVNQTTNTGRWGQIIDMGACCTSPAADYIAFEQVIIHGSPLVDTAQAIQIRNAHAAFTESSIDNIISTVFWEQGIFMSDTSSGPYNVSNNIVNCFCMEMYQESNGGSPNTANDLTLAYNTLYAPLPQVCSGTYFYRQPVEIKGGHRISIFGNLIDGSCVQTGPGPAILLYGVSNYVAGNGISDVLVESNLIRNVPSALECIGNDGGDFPGSQPNVTQRVLVQKNLFLNMGYANHVAPPPAAGGQVNFTLGDRAGCTDFTIQQNTFDRTDPHDTRAGSVLDYIPAIKLMGGGTTFASGFTFANNVVFVSYGTSAYNGGRIFADNPQSNSSYPRLPATVVSNPTNTPTQVLNSLSLVTTNAGSTPNYTWQGNLNICFNFDNGSNNWTDQTSGQCTTTAVGMPSTGGGDTWAAGNTTVARAASVGLDTTTWNCSGCGGAGVNVSNLYPSMKAVQNVAITPAATTTLFAYTAPDSRACYVDTSPDGTTWTRKTDAGGSTLRLTTVSSLSGTTSYSYRILCYYSQESPLWSGNYLTTGSFTTLAGGQATTVIPSRAVMGTKAVIP